MKGRRESSVSIGVEGLIRPSRICSRSILAIPVVDRCIRWTEIRYRISLAGVSSRASNFKGRFDMRTAEGQDGIKGVGREES